MKAKVLVFAVNIALLVNGLEGMNLATEEERELSWAVNNAPPFYIVHGERQGGGFGDRIQEMLIERLPGYQHEIKRRPLNRVVHKMNAGENWCFTTWIHGTRRDIVYTSIPYLYYYPQGLVLKKSLYRQLGSPEVLSLEALLMDSRWVFGKPLGRGYGEKLDPILEKAKSQHNFYVRSSIDSTEGIFKMLNAGRIDYTLEYSYTMNYYKEELGLDSLVFVPLEENRGEAVLGAVAVTRNSWGEGVVKEINQAIREVRRLPEYRDILRDWMLIQGREADYWKKYRRYVLDEEE